MTTPIQYLLLVVLMLGVASGASSQRTRIRVDPYTARSMGGIGELDR